MRRGTSTTRGATVSVTDENGNAITDQDHVANRNPIRYRGYYYDTESGLYYLNSRYYDPVTGRFVNADGYVSTGQDITGRIFLCGDWIWYIIGWNAFNPFCF